jgi:hypothetical protein
VEYFTVLKERGHFIVGLNDDENNAMQNSVPDEEFTDEDLRLGRKACQYIDVLCLISAIVCAGIAWFVLAHVPWNTRMPYDGRFDRSGSGIPMQMAMLIVFTVLFLFWRSGRKPDAHRMRKGSRAGTYILGTAMIVGCVVGQLVLGESVLTAGGYFGNK